MFQGETKNTKRLAYPRSLFRGIIIITNIWSDLKRKTIARLDQFRNKALE